MTAVSINYISFYQPLSSTILYCNKYNASSYYKGRSVSTASSIPLVASQHSIVDQEVNSNSEANEIDNDFLNFEELLRCPLRSEVSIVEPRDLQRIQYLDEQTLESSCSISYNQLQPRLGNRQSNSQGRLLTSPFLISSNSNNLQINQ